MKVIFAVACAIALLLYGGQVISIANFSLAQRLGLQGSPDNSDPLFNHLELWTARWDLWWFWTLPAAGILMLLDHWLWPYAAMVGGGAFVDTGGREAAKVRGLKEQGVRTGTQREYRVYMTTCMFLIASGCLSIGLGLLELN